MGNGDHGCSKSIVSRFEWAIRIARIALFFGIWRLDSIFQIRTVIGVIPTVFVAKRTVFHHIWTVYPNNWNKFIGV